MRKPLTGEPCAGKSHARFGGRGERCSSLPLSVRGGLNAYDVVRVALSMFRKKSTYWHLNLLALRDTPLIDAPKNTVHTPGKPKYRSKQQVRLKVMCFWIDLPGPQIPPNPPFPKGGKSHADALHSSPLWKRGVRGDLKVDEAGVGICGTSLNQIINANNPVTHVQ